MSSLPPSLPACLPRNEHSIQKKEKRQWIPAPPACPPFLLLFRHACQESSILFKIRKRSNGFQLLQHVLPSSLSSGMPAKIAAFFKIRKRSNVFPSFLFSCQVKNNVLKKKLFPIPPACPLFLLLFPHACQVKNYAVKEKLFLPSPQLVLPYSIFSHVPAK
jgi:hypothetical protein